MTESFTMSVVDWTAMVLVVIGALNWGLVGAAHFLTSGGNWNLVNIIADAYPALEHSIYLLVGLAGLWAIYTASRMYTAARETPAPTAERGA